MQTAVDWAKVIEKIGGNVGEKVGKKVSGNVNEKARGNIEGKLDAKQPKLIGICVLADIAVSPNKPGNVLLWQSPMTLALVLVRQTYNDLIHEQKKREEVTVAFVLHVIVGNGLLKKTLSPNRAAQSLASDSQHGALETLGFDVEHMLPGKAKIIEQHILEKISHDGENDIVVVDVQIALATISIFQIQIVGDGLERLVIFGSTKAIPVKLTPDNHGH